MATLLDNFIVRYGAQVTSSGFKALNSDVGQITASLTGLQDKIDQVAASANRLANTMIKVGICQRTAKAL